MIALLRAELLKLRTTRTFVALTGSALGLSMLVVVLTTTLGDSFDEQDVRGLFTADFTGLFILLLGVMGMAGEWRHRTITSTVLAAPIRSRLVAAKVLSYSVAGAAVSLIVTVSIGVVGLLILSSRGEATLGAGDLADVLWRNLVVAALLGGFGVCVGALVRNQVAAIIGVLVFNFALEPTIVALEPEVGRFGPTIGAPGGIQAVETFGTVDLLAPGVALLVMFSWVVLGAVASAAVMRRRDLV